MSKQLTLSAAIAVLGMALFAGSTGNFGAERVERDSSGAALVGLSATR